MHHEVPLTETLAILQHLNAWRLTDYMVHMGIYGANMHFSHLLFLECII